VAGIEIKDASVSYFLRHHGEKGRSLERNAVGGQIIVRQRYLEIAALRNVTLSFKQGDRVGLVGLNGSGKSTLLKLCAGALAVQSGSISIDGAVSAQFSLGAGIKPTLSGRRNAELKCLYMGTPQRTISDRVDEIREISGLGGYFELPVRSYSAGMKSRLVMSLMKLVRGDILVMDEWIGAADATINATVSTLQEDLVRSASIVIMASHSRSVLDQWTDQLVWVDKGQIRKVGPTPEVWEEYQEFIGTNPSSAPVKLAKGGKRRRRRLKGL
jgi:ABC-type polysaccharide/polyol phosphate transport system ATPase subunit